VSGVGPKNFPSVHRRRKAAIFRLCLATAVVFVLSAVSPADDQKKAESELRKITALALDPAARPLVSQTVAEFLKVPRADLVRERHSANLSYGSLLLLHHLVDSGTTVEGISAQLHAGKTIWDIGNEQHADWQQIARDAKKLNERIESAFYNFFREGRPDAGRGGPDAYDAAKDSAAADQEGLTKQDITAAQDTYAHCFQRARGSGDKSGNLPDQNNHNPSATEGDPR
jgi:hypothetical protein